MNRLAAEVSDHAGRQRRHATALPLPGNEKFSHCEGHTACAECVGQVGAEPGSRQPEPGRSAAQVGGGVCHCHFWQTAAVEELTVSTWAVQRSHVAPFW